MAEIKQIYIRDFQSHETTILEPAPAGQLTCIIGPSDSGKTAILRALRWLFYNTPQGTDFIRVGRNAANVTVCYTDGQVVTRARSHKGFNRYVIGAEPATDANKFEGFGTTVPLEVQQITGIRPVEIGDMTLLINLADQLSGPFLGSSVSAPARAKVLGKLAGTEEVDAAAKSTGTDLYRRRQDEKRLGEDVARLQEAIGKYAYLVELGEKIEQAEALLAGIKQNSERVEKLKKLRDERAQIEYQWNKMIQLILRLTSVITISEPFITNSARMIDLRTKLQKAGNELALIDGQIKDVQHVLAITCQIEEAGVIHAQIAANAARLTHLKGINDRWSAVCDKLGKATYILAFGTGWVPEAEILLTSTVKQDTRYTYLHGRREALSMVDFYLNSAQRTLDATQGVDQAYLLATAVQGNMDKLKTLSGAIERYDNCIREIILQDMSLSRLAGIDEATIVLDHIKEQVFTSRQLRYLSLQIGKEGLQGKLDECGRMIVYFAASEKTLSKDYRETLLDAGVCPVCGSQITKENLEEAV
jgi:exonuclease SbcC